MSWTAPELLALLVKTSYLVAAALFLLGLQRMASPATARSGIQWAGVGMLIATFATFFLPGLHNIPLMVLITLPAIDGLKLEVFLNQAGEALMTRAALACN